MRLRERRRTDRQMAADAAEDSQKHAALGAGLVAGIAEFVAEIPQLVAEHHRRFVAFGQASDFNLFNAGLQRTDSRLLATTVRFLELLQEPVAPAAGLLPGT